MPKRRSHAVRTRAGYRSIRRLRATLAGLAATVMVGAPTVLVGAPAAAWEPSTPADPTATADPAGPPIGEAVPGTEICTVSNPELDEITGMVASGDVIYAVEGGTTAQPSEVVIWTISATTCEASEDFYGFTPIDPQDLALGADGALWVADIGRGLSGRERATMERIDLNSGNNAVPFRALYPTDEPINGAAVLLKQDNTPIIIANSGQTAFLYQPNGPMPEDTTEGLPTLQQVGQFTPVNTGTPTPTGAFGRLHVTGAAMSADRSRVVIRTESDAYEFDVTGGDIVAAITQGTPRITPLPDEENGQAITYGADGRFLTLSSAANPVLRAYQPYVPPPPAPAGGAPAGGGGGGGGLDFGDITNIALVTGLLGLAAVVAGVIGIVRARRQYFEAHPEARTRGGAGARARSGAGRVRRGPGSSRRERDDEYDEYESEDDYDSTRPARPPRPRDDAGWAEEAEPTRRAAARVASDDEYAPPPSGGSRPRAGSAHGSGGTTYGSGGTTYGSAGSGSGGSGGSGGGGQVYGSGGGPTYGSGGSTYGPSGTTPGPGGGPTYGSGGRGSAQSGRASVPGSGGGGGVYGRSRPDREGEERRPYGDEDRRPYGDEERRPYGNDNIDL